MLTSLRNPYSKEAERARRKFIEAWRQRHRADVETDFRGAWKVCFAAAVWAGFYSPKTYWMDASLIAHVFREGFS